MHFNSRLLLFCLIPGLVLLQSCGSNEDVNDFLQAEEAARLQLHGLSIEADRTLVNAGEKVQFSASGEKADSAATIVLTNNVNWSSSDRTVLRIDKHGQARAESDGTATVTGSYAYLSDSQTIVVNTAELVSIGLQAPDNVDECKALQISAVGEYADGSQRTLPDTIVWTVSDSDLAVIKPNPEGARLNTKMAGEVMVSATSDQVSGSIAVSINDSLQALSVAPRQANVSVGSNRQFTASGSYSDGSNVEITSSTDWSLADRDIASITDTGLLSAHKAGETTVTGQCGGRSDTVDLITRNVNAERLEINSGAGKLTLDINDDGFQLIVRAINTDGSLTDVTEDAEWSKISPSDSSIQVSDSKGSKGELSITGTGSANIEASYQGLSDTILILVE